jgi:hypothetical protein
VKVERRNGRFTIDGGNYELAFAEGASTILLSGVDGDPWANLHLISAVNAIDRRDETDGVGQVAIEELSDRTRLSWVLGSSLWRRKEVIVECDEEGLTIRVAVEGDSGARLGQATFLGGHGFLARSATGWFESDRRFVTLFSPAPRDPGRIVQSATESSESSATGGAEPGRAGWFFSPGPLWFAGSRSIPDDPWTIPTGSWLGFGLVADPADQGFPGFGYRTSAGGFHFTIDYEGHTTVAERWVSPALRIALTDDPYAGIAAYREWLEARGAASRSDDAAVVSPGRPPAFPRWWLQPMFCGWGAQCAIATARGDSIAAAPGFSTRDRYDEFLGTLEAEDVLPGTIAIDDKWQASYGSGEPDEAKWPDLREWIAERHARGQRILLWWKAWDPEGVPPEHCVRTPDGTPVAIDPNDPDARALIRTAVRRMLSRDHLDADGLKIDFTARTPSGASLRHHGGTWGIGLLRLLLETVRDEAKRLKPDALLIGHVPEPSIAPLLDMIRLNDMLRLDDPEPRVRIVPQMAHRAAVVRAACPKHPIDTDDWCAPDLAEWRAYTEMKPSLGVPSLYYADRLDLSGEMLEPSDYALLRRTWATYRASHRLREPRVHDAV